MADEETQNDENENSDAAEEQPPAEEVVAPEDPAPAEPPSEEEAPAEDAEPVDTHPKALRKRRRSPAPAVARPPRSDEERAAERAERRRSAAARRRRYRQTQRGKRGEPGTGTPPAEREAPDRKVRQGTVISAAGEKTITVKVELVGRHRRYEKVVRRSRTLRAHDESNQASKGDVVRIVETRPLSRTKRWRLVDIVERAR